MPGGVPADWRAGLWTESDGRAEPDVATAAIAQGARKLGVKICAPCAARGLALEGGRARGVFTELGRIDCDTVVLAGGAWSSLLCRALGVRLPQLRVLGSVLRTEPLEGAPAFAVGTFLIFNTITTLSLSYWLTMAARFMSGVAAGLAWGILAGYARRLVPAELQGRALAIAMVGIPVALSLGTLAGAWLGSMMGWRAPFGIMAALAVILFIWTWVAVPDLPGQQADRRLPVWQVF